MAHGLETLLEAAQNLRDTFPAALFLLIGEGAEKARIQGLAASRGLNNVRFLDQQRRELIPSFIRAADATLVLLKKTELFKTVIPTKMLEFMSCARPVILGVDGQARSILEQRTPAFSSNLKTPTRWPKRSYVWLVTTLCVPN